MFDVIFTLNTLMTSSYAYNNLEHKGKNTISSMFRCDNTMVNSCAF